MAAKVLRFLPLNPAPPSQESDWQLPKMELVAMAANGMTVKPMQAHAIIPEMAFSRSPGSAPWHREVEEPYIETTLETCKCRTKVRRTIYANKGTSVSTPALVQCSLAGHGPSEFVQVKIRMAHRWTYSWVRLATSDLASTTFTTTIGVLKPWARTSQAKVNRPVQQWRPKLWFKC